MSLADWIKGNQVLVGVFVICILLIIVSIVVFIIIRSIKRRLVGEDVSSLDVPPKPPKTIMPFLQRIKEKIKQDKPIELRVQGEQRLGMSGIGLQKALEVLNMKTKKPKVPVGQPAETSVAPTVDVNSLTVEQLEQLLTEKKAAAAAQSKQATLLAMPKEELVQIIIDNQIEI